MSTIKSSSEHLTLNADGSGKEVKIQRDGTEVLATTSSGVDITGSVSDTDGNVRSGRKNLIINGAMQVAQRGTSATVSDNSNEQYSTLDRWYLNFNNSIGGAVTFSQSTDTPSGFGNSLKIQCSTTDTSFSTNEYVSVSQLIEAQDLQRLSYGTAAAKQITLSWQMKTDTYTGPITVAFETNDGTVEYYVKSYTPTTSWAEYTCTIPASTSATINNDNGNGMRVSFVLAGHTSSSIAAASDSTAWSTTRADYRSNIGNILSNTSNAIYITGVQLEVGTAATDFEHRSYGEELALCQRYYYQLIDGASQSVGSGWFYASTSASVVIPHPVTMRTTPSVVRTSGTNYFRIEGGGYSLGISGNFTVNNSTPRVSRLYDNTSVSGGTTGHGNWWYSSSSSARLALDAEL